MALFYRQPRVVAAVIVPVPVRRRFDYLVPEGWESAVHVGLRVLVPFGKNKRYTGVVAELRHESDTKALGELKPLAELLDRSPAVPVPLLNLWAWTARYYHCSEGEVLKAALPADLKLESEWVVTALRDPEDILAAPEQLSDEQHLVLEALAVQPELTGGEIRRLLGGGKDPAAILKRLADRGFIELRSEVYERYKPRTERVFTLGKSYTQAGQFAAAFAAVAQAPKQLKALQRMVEAHLAGQTLTVQDFAEDDLRPAVLRSLVQKGLLEEAWQEIDRLGPEQGTAGEEFTLTPAQQSALQALWAHTSSPNPPPVLLHGVTGSGKTHLYLKLMETAVANGQQVLYLLPEIGLTPQLTERIRAVFGAAVGVYHSRFSNPERVEIWRKVLNGTYQVVVGVRSAVFLPFQRLGLVVVDEEHDASFKQHEPAPRYHARDLAVWQGRQLKIPVVLGSATPSLETWHNAQTGKYGLVALGERPPGSQLPALEVVDMRPQYLAKTSHGQFSDTLLEALRNTLKRGEQAILFKNRRGFANYLQCSNCGHVPHCIHCDISLTYHRQANILRCHYCGFTDARTHQCGSCGSQSLQHKGIGTEQLEIQLAALFPQASVARMDQDTTRGKRGFSRLIERFGRQEIDILVGTQMVTKGLNFPNVTLVAVVDADRLLNVPDFRAHETAVQLLTQFSGRAGRGAQPGRVLLQTLQPEHLVFQHLRQPYEVFAQSEWAARQGPQYPPQVRLIRLELKHTKRELLEQEAPSLATLLRKKFPNVLGPEYPNVARIRNQYRQFILLKLPASADPWAARRSLDYALDAFAARPDGRKIRVVVDVDPR